jgi:phosphomannomutase
MPSYAKSLTDAILRETGASGLEERPLEGLKIVFNSGNGSGGFFNDVLKNLGADVSASMFVEHNSAFPNGVPNPESQSMVDATMKVCQESKADLGIMLDTDADRSGFIVPSSTDEDSTYEPLNRNRLIALLGVLFAETSPGCTIVTDSVTSEGLANFLQQDLGLHHVRYLKGYANVIAKARELTDTGDYNAEVAIETSGHCAMRENDYLDDGTYTAVKVIGLLAKVKKEKAGNLLELISGMVEMPETAELRMTVNDESLETTADIFDFMQMEIERALCGEEECTLDWMVDEENLEGMRVRTMMSPGGFFMLRKSLHDPLISMQIEGEDREEVLLSVVQPILKLFSAEERIRTTVDLSVLENY